MRKAAEGPGQRPPNEPRRPDKGKGSAHPGHADSAPLRQASPQRWLRRWRHRLLWLTAALTLAVALAGGILSVSARARRALFSVPGAASAAQALQTLRPRLIPGNNARCVARLRKLPIAFHKAKDRKGALCRVDHAVTVTRVAGIKLHRPALMNCAAAEALTLWARDSVAPAARKHLGANVRVLRHIGTYNCRTLRTSHFWMSEHSFANAIDISGFVDGRGRSVTLLKHWRDRGGRGRFLRAIARGACQPWRLVLTPNSNAAHRDHFHLDLGWWSSCGG